jgi:glycerol-3-phosphate dehydrogenase
MVNRRRSTTFLCSDAERTALIYDLAIIGGGINGCGIARDAAGRGLSVYLCEQGDFGGATSSASTKLIHGGLRYLETFQLRLVRESLAEREVLLRAAPHLVRPRRFVLPHHRGLRPRWLLRLGLFIYDHLARGITLPPARGIDLRNDPAGAALKPHYVFGFEYSDCTVDDSRLVILNAIDARNRGARLESRTRCSAAERKSGRWNLTLTAALTGARSEISARVLVNAAGPWAGEVSRDIVHAGAQARLRLDKGSHIVVRRLFEHDRAYVFQNADGRIVFAIPYEQDFTLIGTTEEDFRGDPATAAIDASEIDYLCAAAGQYFRKPVSREAVVWTYSGVRALHDNGALKSQKLSRDYRLELDAPKNEAPLLTFYGGKLTTYRRLAETALARLAPHLPMSGPWTSAAILPGGDAPEGGMRAVADALTRLYPFLARSHVERLVRAYGTRAASLIGGARCSGDLGEWFGADLTEAELRYLIREEWAETAADVLWRRSKLGLHFPPDEIYRLETWIASARVN